jgi:hypothetical protein
MARGRCHSLDSPLEAMLGLTSRSLTSFQATADESQADADAIAAPPILDATATVPDAKAKCSFVANITAAEPPGCTDAAMIEDTTSTSPSVQPSHNAQNQGGQGLGPCFKCGMSGHLARQCSDKLSATGTGSQL